MFDTWLSSSVSSLWALQDAVIFLAFAPKASHSMVISKLNLFTVFVTDAVGLRPLADWLIWPSLLFSKLRIYILFPLLHTVPS